MAITRTASGLLARHEAGSATHPFDPVDWSAFDALVSLSGGRLRLAGGAGGAYGAVRHIAVADRAKSFVQVAARAISDRSQVAAAAHVTDADELAQALLLLGPSQPNPTFFVGEPGNNATASTPAVPLNVDQVISLFADGLDLLGRSITTGHQLTHTIAQNSSGGVGVRVLTLSPTEFVDVSAFFAMADRFVVVSGLPPGHKARIGPVTVVEDGGGTATLDLLAVPFPQPTLEVLDPADVVLDFVSPPDGVWGGDAFSVGQIVPATPTLTVAPVTGTPVTLLSSPYAGPGAHASSRWQIARSDDPAFVAPVLDTGADAVHLLSFPWPPVPGDFLARVLHTSDEGEDSDFSAAVAFTVPVWFACPPPPATAWEQCPVPAPTSQGSAYRDAVLASGPELYWRLDDTSGQSVHDETGQGRDGNIIGPVQFGTLGLLPGSARSITLPPGSDEIRRGWESWMSVGGAMAVEMWIQLDDTDTLTVLASMGDISGPGSWVLYVQNRHLVIRHFHDHGFVESVGDALLLPGVAYQVGAAVNHAGTGARAVYVDGVNDGGVVSGPGGSNPAENTQFPFKVAGPGVIDEVSVYAGLSTGQFEAEFAAHYAARLDPEATSPWDPCPAPPEAAWDPCPAP